MNPSPKYFNYTTLLLSVLIAAGGYLALSLWAGWHQVIAAIRLAGLPIMLLALSLSLLNYLLRFLRWQYYLRVLGHRVPWRWSLQVYFAGFALTTTPGKLGEGIRSAFLKRNGVTVSESLAAFFADRFSDLIAIVLLSVLGLSLYQAGRPIMIAVIIGIIFVLWAIQRQSWIHALASWASRHDAQKIGRLMGKIADLILHFRRCFQLSTLLIGLGLSVPAWLAEACAFYWLTHQLGLAIPLPTAVFIYAFSMLIGGLSFLPGGLGSAEGMMMGLLVIQDVPQASAAAATLLIRLATLWFAVAIGLLVFPRKQPPHAA